MTDYFTLFSDPALFKTDANPVNTMTCIRT